jgi:PAS domain S-box-containing protein
MVPADGRRHNVIFSKATFPKPEGSLGGLVGTILDITERKRAEDALREREEQLATILRTATDGFWVTDVKGHLLEVNEAVCRNLGYSRDELLRMSVSDIEVVEKPEEILRVFQRIMERGSGRFEGLHRCKNGSLRNVEISVNYLPPPHDRFFAFLRDITERKRAEEEKLSLELHLLQAQKLESLGVMAGGIAHDFNNLLTVVLGHAELALKEISPTSPARGSLTEITTAARRAADLSLQMLAYTGKMVFAVERVGLPELAEEMARLLKTAISKEANLTLNLERGVPPIQADPTQIRQIVMNLIINASEALGDRSGAITVSVGTTRCDEKYLRNTLLHDDLPPGLYVRLEVTDTGIGMDEKTRLRIFEPFFSTKFTGRGLGLAAVLGIVRAHKGALKVHSEPGKGTTFEILFPALEDAGAEAPADVSSTLADRQGTGTILLVDDEESLLTLGSRMLEHLGFTVLTAADGLQAVERYREKGEAIDLVLMDLTMPHMDGAKAFDEMRRLNPDARVVLASGYAEEDVSSRFEGKKPAGIIQKPYTLAKLREALAGLMPARPTGG